MNNFSNAPARGFRRIAGDDVWQQLLLLGQPHTYRAGEYLLQEGERGGFVLALARGRVRVNKTLEDGSEVLAALRSAGDLLGEMMSRPESARSAHVLAIDNCAAYVIKYDAFQQFVTAPLHSHAYNDYLISKITDGDSYRLQLSAFSSFVKVSRLLYELHALADAATLNPMRIPLSQEHVGKSLGYVRSTVAKHVDTLRACGALEAGPKLIVADPKKLAQCAEIPV